jgi:hypothetical protein
LTLISKAVSRLHGHQLARRGLSAPRRPVLKDRSARSPVAARRPISMAGLSMRGLAQPAQYRPPVGNLDGLPLVGSRCGTG